MTGFGVPARASGPLALAAPAAELPAAVPLLPGQTAIDAAITALGLVAVFSVAIAANLVRGRAPEHHCSGPGEIELRGDDVAGIGVHIAARVTGIAGSGEVLATRTVKDLVIGSNYGFSSRGLHRMQGVPHEWELLAVEGAAEHARLG